MRRNKIQLITMLAVTAVVVTLTAAAPASALTGQSDVQKIIQTKTGKTAAPMTTPQKAGNVSIGVGRSAGKALESYAQTPDTKSARVLAVVEDASQSVVTYPVTSPAGTRVEPQPDGSVKLVSEIAGPPASQSGTYTTTAPVTTIDKPWAVDAAGKNLPTTYAFANGVLTQKINTAGATFPVVADPTWSLGWYLYVHLTRTEVFKAYGASSYMQMGWIACGFLLEVPYAVPACAIYAAWALTNLGQGVYTAAHSVWNGNSACVTAEIAIAPVSYYAGYYLNACTNW